MEIRNTGVLSVTDRGIGLVDRNVLLGRFLINEMPKSITGGNTNIVMVKGITVVVRHKRKNVFKTKGNLLIRMYKDEEGQEHCLTLELKAGKRIFDLQEILEDYEDKEVYTAWLV